MDPSRPGRGTRAARPLHPRPSAEGAEPSIRAVPRLTHEPLPEPSGRLERFAPLLAGPHRVREVEAGGADRTIRPLRCGPLRDLLDEEFRRNQRFEAFSSFFGDLRAMLRKAVVREEDLDLGPSVREG